VSDLLQRPSHLHVRGEVTQGSSSRGELTTHGFLAVAGLVVLLTKPRMCSQVAPAGPSLFVHITAGGTRLMAALVSFPSSASTGYPCTGMLSGPFGPSENVRPERAPRPCHPE
jgi:hypothetical protein